MRSVKLEQAKEVTKLRQEVEQGAKELASKYERKMKVSQLLSMSLQLSAMRTSLLMQHACRWSRICKLSSQFLDNLMPCQMQACIA